ncbi:hypothetical protein Aph02nite_25270 [Actinoplanes philippinensis]|nr:hypothetical protein Aph02nite_25270 [Actinoplanes philippinensis]
MISRLIDAPRELVFTAFTEVRHLSRWWGPEGFSTTTQSFQFGEGAATRLEMRTVFPTREQRDRAVEKYHAIEGGRQTLEHLAAYVTGSLL